MDPHSDCLPGVLEAEEGWTDLWLGSHWLGGGGGRLASASNTDPPRALRSPFMISSSFFCAVPRLNMTPPLCSAKSICSSIVHNQNVCHSSGGTAASIWSQIFQSGASQSHIWQGRAFPAPLRQTQPAHGVCVRNLLHGKPFDPLIICPLGVFDSTVIVLLILCAATEVIWCASCGITSPSAGQNFMAQQNKNLMYNKLYVTVILFFFFF